MPGPSGLPGRPALPRFVLHEHRKPQHHFDLRLEEDGVLRSWAVPRGLPTDTKRNKLAVHVDDHEVLAIGIDYALQLADHRPLP